MAEKEEFRQKKRVEIKEYTEEEKKQFKDDPSKLGNLLLSSGFCKNADGTYVLNNIKRSKLTEILIRFGNFAGIQCPPGNGYIRKSLVILPGGRMEINYKEYIEKEGVKLDSIVDVIIKLD